MQTKYFDAISPGNTYSSKSIGTKRFAFTQIVFISCVDTKTVLELTIDEVKNRKSGFICTNVQETDLAGHSQNSRWYKELLEIADEKIGEIITLLKEEDILVVMADHGNDPNIGHNRHTRENVPLLIYKKGITGVSLGLRSSLSDVGATVCEYFNVKQPQNGSSFLRFL
ncbi:alkaline phosphatase family protein [Anaerocolumna aminovalerica]|uniref:alkaline phosphatase family protein n=1 Tax=Anaerocolumna aminovalerica TaxID=1527 RepID=UPI000B83674F